MLWDEPHKGGTALLVLAASLYCQVTSSFLFTNSPKSFSFGHLPQDLALVVTPQRVSPGEQIPHPAAG